MSNQNGQFVIQALYNLKEPATAFGIAVHIAEKTGLKLETIRATVEETLAGGVVYGYVQRRDRKYLVKPCDLNNYANFKEAGGARTACPRN